MSGRYHFRRGNYHYKPMELEYGRKVLSHIFKRNNYYTMTIGKPQVSPKTWPRDLKNFNWNFIEPNFQCIFSPLKTKSEKIMTIEITFSKKERGFGPLIDHFHPDHIAVFPVEVISKMMLLWPHSTDGQFSWTSEWKMRLPFKLKAQTKTLFGRIRTTGIF